MRISIIVVYSLLVCCSEDGEKRKQVVLIFNENLKIITFIETFLIIVYSIICQSSRPMTDS